MPKPDDTRRSSPCFSPRYFLGITGHMGITQTSVARRLAVALCIAVIVLATASLARFSATQGTLILTAAPLTLVPIAGLHFLRDAESRAGWVAVTFWLGLTYAAGGETAELAVCAAIFALGLAGYFGSAWCFPLAWFGHIAWDFVPRTLPELLADLPTACMIFDGIIGIYLVAMARKRWVS